MTRSRLPLVAAGLLAAFLFVQAGDSLERAEARGRDEHLRYAPTWAAAVEEARARNTVIFATFHKDK